MTSRSLTSFIAWISLAGLLLISACQEGHQRPIPTPACYIGTWGNDYLLCGNSSAAGNQGGGPLEERLQQELRLVLKADNSGDFYFYDCQNKAYFPGTIRFTYRIDDDKITFSWQGTPSEIRTARETFNLKTTYRFQCQGDRLVFPDRDLQSGGLYDRTVYFLRR